MSEWSPRKNKEREHGSKICEETIVKNLPKLVKDYEWWGP